MTRITSLAVVAALILWVCAPALACLVDAHDLTAAEMACCHEMKGDCGGMAMEQHGCCPPVPVKVQSDKKVFAVAHRPLTLAPPASIEALISLAALPPQPHTPNTIIQDESPPGAPLSLRI